MLTSFVQSAAQQSPLNNILFAVNHGVVWMMPNEQSSATRPTGRHDCNRSAMAGLDAMKGCVAWAERAHAESYEPQRNPS